MHLLNVSNRFKKLLLLQWVEIRFSIIIFASKIRLCIQCKRHHLTKSLFYFICFLFKHAIQRIHFKISVCNSRSRRQSFRTHLIFRIIRNFDDESRKKYFLFAFVNALSKVFYKINLRILLFKFKTVFNKMFLFITIITTFVVFRIIVHFIRDLLKQTNDIIATIFVIKSISLFRAFFRIFSATVKSFTRIKIAFI